MNVAIIIAGGLGHRIGWYSGKAKEYCLVRE